MHALPSMVLLGLARVIDSERVMVKVRRRLRIWFKDRVSVTVSVKVRSEGEGQGITPSHTFTKTPSLLNIQVKRTVKVDYMNTSIP